MKYFKKKIQDLKSHDISKSILKILGFVTHVKCCIRILWNWSKTRRSEEGALSLISEAHSVKSDAESIWNREEEPIGNPSPTLRQLVLGLA